MGIRLSKSATSLLHRPKLAASVEEFFGISSRKWEHQVLSQAHPRSVERLAKGEVPCTAFAPARPPTDPGMYIEQLPEYREFT
jgi:hypothetical protein